MPTVSQDPSAEFISLAAFVQRAGISKRTLFRMLADGQVRSVGLRRRRLIPASELARLSGTTGAYPYQPSAKAKSA